MNNFLESHCKKQETVDKQSTTGHFSTLNLDYNCSDLAIRRLVLVCSLCSLKLRFERNYEALVAEYSQEGYPGDKGSLALHCQEETKQQKQELLQKINTAFEVLGVKRVLNCLLLAMNL